MTVTFRKGDVGVPIKVTVVKAGAAVNISTATTLKILLVKPDATLLTKTAVFDSDGSDGKMKYVTIAGDLDQEGVWQIQGELTMTGLKHTADGSFMVGKTLD